MILKSNLQIAIDGPSGSGKSLTTLLLAKKLGIFYLNTGATFRAVALLALRKGYAFKDKKFLKSLKEMKMEILLNKSGDYQIILNGEDVTDKLFLTQLDWGASCLAAVPRIREILTSLWRKTARNKAMIIEGRDIAQVFPNSDLKIYMTANTGVRAKRIWLKLKKQGINKNFQQVLDEVKKRDKQDASRQANPLKFSSDYWLLDTSKLKPSQVVEAIIKKLKKMKLVT